MLKFSTAFQDIGYVIKDGKKAFMKRFVVCTINAYVDFFSAFWVAVCKGIDK